METGILIVAIIVIIVMGGALGGLARFLSRIKIQKTQEGSPPEFVLDNIVVGRKGLCIAFHEMVIGIAAALGLPAIFMTMLSVNNMYEFTEGLDINKGLFLLFISVIAGLAARPLIDILCNKLMRDVLQDIEQGKEKDREHDKKIKEMLEKEERMEGRLYKQIMLLAYTAIKNKDTSVGNECIEMLEKFPETFVKDLQAHLLNLACLYKLCGNIPLALKTVDKVIAISQNDKEKGYAYYNRACYKALSLNNIENVDSVIGDLRDAYRFNQELVRAYLGQEEDFRKLTDIQEFKDFKIEINA